MTEPVLTLTIDRENLDRELAKLNLKIVPLAAEQPAAMIGESSMLWDLWSGAIGRLDLRPGWAPASIACRTTTDRAEFVLGVVRDFVGIFARTGTIRSQSIDTGAIELKEGVPIFVLVHLRSGIRIGLFETMDDAVMCAEMCLRVEEWRSLKGAGDPAWSPAACKAKELTFMCGIVYDESTRVHVDAENGHYPLFRRMDEVLSVGRPQVLS